MNSPKPNRKCNASFRIMYGCVLYVCCTLKRTEVLHFGTDCFVYRQEMVADLASTIAEAATESDPENPATAVLLEG